MLREPPDILITTPESLFLLLTSQRARAAAQRRHADPRRGARRRRDEARRPSRALGRAARGARCAAAAADRPLGDAAPARGDRPFVSGGRPIELVDAGVAKELDLEVVVPVEDMREPGDSREEGYEPRSIWPSIYPALVELVRAHRSTIVFVNNRRLAERLALRLNESGGGGDRARAPRLARARAADADRGGPEGGPDPVPRRDLVARARHRHGRGRPRDPGRVAEVGRPRPAADRPRRPLARRGLARAASSRSSAPTCSSRAVVAQRMREGADRGDADPAQPARRPRAADRRHLRRRGDRGRGAARARAPRVSRSPTSRARSSRTSSTCSPGRYPSDEFAELRPRIIWDRTAGVLRGRPGARRLAVTNAGTIPDRGLFGVFIAGEGGRAASASSTRRWSTRRAPAR